MARMPCSQSPPVWPQMRRMSGFRRASATRSFGRGFAGVVAHDLEPGVLEDDRLQFVRAADEGVEFRFVAVAGDPKFDADHRTVGDAAIEFGEAFRGIFPAEVNEPEKAVRPLGQHGEHLVVLFAKICRRRVLAPGVAHIEAEAFDTHAVGGAQELFDPLFRAQAAAGGEMAMEIPDAHGFAVWRFGLWVASEVGRRVEQRTDAA